LELLDLISIKAVIIFLPIQMNLSLAFYI